MNDDVMNAIRGSVTKLLASEPRVGGPHSTPADVVAVPTSMPAVQRSTPGFSSGDAPEAVSYTHLTLPTILLV